MCLHVPRFLFNRVAGTQFKSCLCNNWNWNPLFTSSVFTSLLDLPRPVRSRLLSHMKLPRIALRDYVNYYYYYYRYYVQRLVFSRNAFLGGRNVISRRSQFELERNFRSKWWKRYFSVSHNCTKNLASPNQKNFHILVLIWNIISNYRRLEIKFGVR